MASDLKPANGRWTARGKIGGGSAWEAAEGDSASEVIDRRFDQPDCPDRLEAVCLSTILVSGIEGQSLFVA